MSSSETGGSENSWIANAPVVASVPAGQLVRFSMKAFDLACRGSSDSPEDSKYKFILDRTLSRNQALYVAKRDISAFTLNFLYPYSFEQKEKIEDLSSAASVGTTSASYNLLRNPDISRIISEIGKYGLSEFIPPAMAAARDPEEREEIRRRIKFRAPAIGNVLDFFDTNSKDHRSLTKMFGYNPSVDFDVDFDFDDKLLEYGKVYRQSADSLIFSFMGAVGLAGLEQTSLSLESQAYIEKDLLAYDRFTPLLRRRGFDARKNLNKYSPVFLNVYDIITTQFKSTLDELTDYQEMPQITGAFNEACFVGLRMLIQDRSIRKAITNADSQLLIQAAKTACDDAFVISTELDGRSGKRQLVHDLPMSASILRGISMKEYMETVDNFDKYDGDQEPAVDADLSAYTVEELDRAMQISAITPRDALERAAITLAQTIFVYVRAKENRL